VNPTGSALVYSCVHRRLPVVVVSLLAAALLLVGLGPPAHAGGSWFRPVKDRSEPGEPVTLVGYTGGGTLGGVEDGPFDGYLVTPDGARLPVGRLDVRETGQGGYLTLRASITFTLPADLGPGVYEFHYCNAACDEGLGDIIGGEVFVGVDPSYPVSREWALDDPEIANLADDARLVGPGWETTAGELRAGHLPRPPTFDTAAPSEPTTVPMATAVEEPSGGTSGATTTSVVGGGALAAASLALFGARRRRGRPSAA